MVPLSGHKANVRIGSKKFTESVILGELISQLWAAAGATPLHYQELGGTRVAFNALVDGQIDAYPEYTGTIEQEILAVDASRQEKLSLQEISRRLAAKGVGMSAPLGFNNTYALATTRETAARLKIANISDLNSHPELRLGFTNEFMDRNDGWPGLARQYGLKFESVQGIDHDIAYRQLQSGAIQVADVYSTDSKIDTMGLAVLEDDRKFFPRYDSVILYRLDLEQREPGCFERLADLEGNISVAEMIEMNRLAEEDRVPESQVAGEFLARKLQITLQARKDSPAKMIVRRTVEHLDLVRKSLIPAILVGIPLGIVCFRSRPWRLPILGGVSIIQTIPALALLVMLLPIVNWAGGRSIGVGAWTAVLALFLYSLLPIVRGTFSGLAGIEPQYHESADAMGLSTGFKLWNIELPLAQRSILSGIKVATVLNIGFATLGALIGAGGYGQPILTGIRLADTMLILQGAIPAALLAVVAQLGIEFFERRIQH